MERLFLAIISALDSFTVHTTHYTVYIYCIYDNIRYYLHIYDVYIHIRATNTRRFMNRVQASGVFKTVNVYHGAAILK